MVEITLAFTVQVSLMLIQQYISLHTIVPKGSITADMLMFKLNTMENLLINLKDSRKKSTYLSNILKVPTNILKVPRKSLSCKSGARNFKCYFEIIVCNVIDIAGASQGFCNTDM